MRSLSRALATLAVGVCLSNPALAREPWIDLDPEKPPERYIIGAVGVRAEAEYRSQLIYINPISLNTENNRRASWLDHRLRLGTSVDYEEMVSIHFNADLFDGVVWGDNGTFTEPPVSKSGLNATAREPNVVRPCIGLQAGADPLNANSYGYSLCEADIIVPRRMYGQVLTPVGVIRVGRQAVGVGTAVQTADGDGRPNRFGVAGTGDMVDRILFGTKPLEAFKPKAERNTSIDEGLIVAGIYDRWVTDSLKLFNDDVQAGAAAIRYLRPDFGFGRDLEVQVFYAHRWDGQFDTRINSIGGRVAARISNFWFRADMAGNFGRTSEVSTAYSLISNDPVQTQEVLQYGARAVVRFDQPWWTAYFEVDYASGDEDPQAGTPLTQFVFAEDTNVGLLMFEHVLRFQSARSSAAGNEIVRRLGATTFPSERIHTRGAFTNAFAIFPQLDVRPHKDILFRGGVLAAWAPAKVIDQVGSLQGRDGNTIEDDLVNFVGGAPGKFYGVEIDGRFQWRLLDHFALDLEGAVLFPGDVFEDRNGQAVNSVLLQGRTTFFF